MSLIQAELSRLMQIGQDVERMEQRAASVEKEVWTVGSRVEGAILARRGLSGRIGGSASGIGRIESRLGALSAYILSAVERYERADKDVMALLSASGIVSGKSGSVWGWLKDRADGARAGIRELGGDLQLVGDTLDGWLGQGNAFLDEALAYGNRQIDYLRTLDIMGGAPEVGTFFKSGVLKGALDTIGSFAKLGLQATRQAYKPIADGLEAVGYVYETAFADDPLGKLKEDLIAYVDSQVLEIRTFPERASATYEATLHAFSSMLEEYRQADTNRKAEMVGFGTEKLLELLIPLGAGAKAATAAGKAESAAVKAEGLIDGLPVAGKGVGSAYDHVYTSTKLLDDIFPELKGINPHYVDGAGPGVNTNCVSCANAATARLIGDDVFAVAQASKGYGGRNDLLYSAPFGTQKNLSVSDVSKQLLEAGDGANGIVIIHQGSVEHVINVVNRNGEIYYIDTQIGKIVELHPTLKLELGVR
ncbi:toxin glutamine deamidase domain-containing protein [Cohnella fermenti]|uniref:Tox-PL domain-containing protein n=1 Tax=Cohnella fermenti TaxID=2565925 RepID=A0A4S4BIV0_9BACL|nr:toxin glutamine deamidase domain-containing protein [Cohnella fermenti]THF73947.1 hypothetical protein E6C55_27140 [Cohnella fermenti]